MLQLVMGDAAATEDLRGRAILILLLLLQLLLLNMLAHFLMGKEGEEDARGVLSPIALLGSLPKNTSLTWLLNQ